jgi:flavin-dependent dehydrogenase
MTGVPDYDVIVVGAGHNGLAATAILAKRGFRVLCLEKNAYVGGMAGTREIHGVPERRRREPAVPASRRASPRTRARALTSSDRPSIMAST